MKTRVRILAVILIVLALTALAVGCGKKDEGTPFTVVSDLTKLSTGLQTSISLDSYAKGYTWFEDETGGYLCVSYGNDSPTTPEVTAVVLDKETMRVTVGEQPVTGGAASSVSRLTVVRIDGAKNVTSAVADAKGNALSQLIPSSGTYNGQIDTTSIEITAQGGPSAFQLDGKALPFFDSASPLFRDFQSKEQVRFCYLKNAQGQLVITYIEKAK